MLHGIYPQVYRTWIVYANENGHIYANYPPVIDIGQMCSEEVLCDYPFEDSDECDLDFLFLASPDYNPNKEVYLSLPYLDHVEINSIYEPLIRIAYPLYYGDDFKGAVGMDLYIDNLLGDLFHSKPTENGHYLLVDHDLYINIFLDI